MGWTYTHKEKGTSVKSFFEKEFNQTFPYGKVLDCATKGGVAYLAYAHAEKDQGIEQARVYGIVCLLAYKRKDYYNFGYKDMDEGMGPYACECPARILDLLTPTDNLQALSWRKTCRANLNKPKLKTGDEIEFAEPIDFGSYGKLKKFIYRKGSVFAARDYATLFRIRGWKQREFKVVSMVINGERKYLT